MAYEIIETCVNCWACEPLCPSQAISLSSAGAGSAHHHFLIDASKCTECDGDFSDPQCVSICPIEGAILNGFGEAANPAGSLTGIPPERMVEVMAEIQAR
ncbi:MAG: 4Fe-4S dicluster domain-containing protein [Candidatus Thiodiazotropha sp.]|jgi:Fe-S-cluster-containing hydrogenase component 2